MQPMTPQAFIEKWRASRLKESAAYVEHFTDLCRVLGQKTPADADPKGEFFTFQKGVKKNAIGQTVLEDALFGQQPVKEGTNGFADVWYRGHFAWEYKGKHKDLGKALEQLYQYLDDLENPPLLVVSDFERFEIHTRFNNCVKKVYQFTNEQLAEPNNLATLRALFEDPDALKPSKTTRGVTEDVARQFATLSESLRKRGVEARHAAHFLMKLLFCLFAEDVKLLPNDIFTRIVAKCAGGPGIDPVDDAEEYFVKHVRSLFRAMRRGGEVWGESIDHFNGGLFEDDKALPLEAAGLEILYYCCKQDWASVEPSIFGTLFERSLDPDKRSQLGAHYTSKEDIALLVEPVLMQPLRREWDDVKKKAIAVRQRRDAASGKEYAKRDKALRRLLEDFAQRLSTIRVLDPACGSGNFLYVSLNLLKDLEKEVFTLAAKCGYTLFRFVGPEQLYGIELNPYAVELARLVVWIGHIQWDKNNQLYRPDVPILKPLKNIKEMDAILRMKDGIASEPAWPECEVIVGNPPFLGGKRMRKELGSEYLDSLFELYEDRVPHEADLCCYWFEKARKHITDGACKRAGLLATQGIRGGANREVLKRIKESGDIFFAISDREWVLDGATVHISMVGFDSGFEKSKVLDRSNVESISPQLSPNEGMVTAEPILENLGVSFMGITPAGAFDMDDQEALKIINSPNPNGRSSSDVMRPYVNGMELNKRPRNYWSIDFGTELPFERAAEYEAAIGYLTKTVKPTRIHNRREVYAKNWWLYAEARPAMRRAFSPYARYLATCMVSKHRIFVWLSTVVLPANVVIVFARADDYFFGVVHSKIHEFWSRAQGTQLRERESGFRYTPTTCFETFPLPLPSKAQESAIAVAAKELDTLRNNWLNPPDWVREEVLTFPGSKDGPWARYVRNANGKGSGTVHYPRLVPRDADFAAKLASRTLTNLYNERPTWLDLAHKKLDAAVAAAYGWPADLSDDEILKRLLALNIEYARAGEFRRQ